MTRTFRRQRILAVTCVPSLIIVLIVFLPSGGKAVARTVLFTFTTIDVPFGVGTTTAADVNDSGEIVGQFFDGLNYHAFLLSRSLFSEIDDASIAPNFVQVATEINEYGAMVGHTCCQPDHGFLRSRNGIFTYFDDPIAGPNAFGTYPSGMNNVGQIVGNSFDGNGAHAFVRSATGSTFTRITVPNSLSGTTVASGINNRGQIVGGFSDATGGHYFLRSTDGSTFTILNGPSGTTRPFAYDINDPGEIVGTLQDASGQHGFLRDTTGNFLIIDHPDACGPSGCFTSVFGINNKGQVVGEFRDTSGSGHGFVATPRYHALRDVFHSID